MEDKFKNRYCIESVRMQNWDYGWQGQYYITICTRGREFYFGEIIDGQMTLSEIGEIVKSEWLKSPKIRPDMNLELDEFVIMPNHFHGIIQIGNNKFNKFDDQNIIHRRDTTHRVSTTDKTNEQPLQTGKNKFGPQKNNLSSIIRGFKSSVTKNARKINSDFGWQSGFYEHLIRDEKSLNTIQKYISENPENWAEDELHPDIQGF